jgi:hypothetical protein
MYVRTRIRHARRVRNRASGSPYATQSRKPMLSPLAARAPTAMAFGGLPRIVAIPPVVAAIGMPRMSPLATGEPFPSRASSGVSAATTIAVVAVFEISIEKTMVIIIRPKRTRRGWSPHIFSVSRMTSSSSFVLVIAFARKKPPIISQTTLLEKVLA